MPRLARQILSLHQKWYLLSQPTCHPPPFMPPFIYPATCVSPLVLLFRLPILLVVVVLAAVFSVFLLLFLLRPCYCHSSLYVENAAGVIKTPRQQVNNPLRTTTVYICTVNTYVSAALRECPAVNIPAGTAWRRYIRFFP